MTWLWPSSVLLVILFYFVLIAVLVRIEAMKGDDRDSASENRHFHLVFLGLSRLSCLKVILTPGLGTALAYEHSRQRQNWETSRYPALGLDTRMMQTASYKVAITSEMRRHGGIVRNWIRAIPWQSHIYLKFK